MAACWSPHNLQTTVANADVFDYVPTDPDAAVYTALGGLPPLDQLSTAALEYNVVDAGTGAVTGHFDGVSSQDVDLFGLSTHEVLVTSDTAGNTAYPDAPPVGSLFDTTDVFGLKEVYADMIGTDGAHTITNTLVTPVGDISIPVVFDAAAALPAAEFTAPASTTDAFSFATDGAEKYTSISSLPLQQTIVGTQAYTVSDGGSFDGISLHSVNAFGPDVEEIFVNGDTTAGAPSDGSVFTTLDYGHGVENVYSDVVGTGAGGTNTVTDTLVTPLGDFKLPMNFDAAAAAQAATFTHPADAGTDAGYTFSPTGDETFTSIGG